MTVKRAAAQEPAGCAPTAGLEPRGLSARCRTDGQLRRLLDQVRKLVKHHRHRPAEPVADREQRVDRLRPVREGHGRQAREPRVGGREVGQVLRVRLLQSGEHEPAGQLGQQLKQQRLPLPAPPVHDPEHGAGIGVGGELRQRLPLLDAIMQLRRLGKISHTLIIICNSELW